MLGLFRDRSLAHADAADVVAALSADPVGACMVAARVEQSGFDRALAGHLWTNSRPADSLCYSGANLMPLFGGETDMAAFADRALRGRRICTSIVGRAELVLPLWARLAPSWGPAREIRARQPLLRLDDPPIIAPDPAVRLVRPVELEPYLSAAVRMFIAEVGVDPRAGDGGRGYRSRMASLIEEGRAFASFDRGRVVFKAEIGALSHSVGQIQGVWVDPVYRGRGLGAAGTAAVAQHIVASGRAASLYVNGYNQAARTAYARVGFTSDGTFATVLID